MTTPSNTKHALTVGLTLALIVGCGTSGGPSSGGDGGSHGQCPSGEVYCTSCTGGGYCSPSCDGVYCPPPGGDSGAPDGGCPAGTPTPCMGCDGVAFCSVGSCPVVRCAHLDAGADVIHTCVPLSCEGLGCECGSCIDTACGGAAMDCGSCSGNEDCASNKCVGAPDASHG